MAQFSASRLVSISIIFYLLSLVTPAFSYRIPDNPDTFYCLGFLPLKTGWLALLIAIVEVTLPIEDLRILGLSAWLANPLILSAWIGISNKAKTISIYSIVAALILSFFFFFLDELSLPEVRWTNITVNIGYFLWIFSLFFALLAANRLEITSKKSS